MSHHIDKEGRFQSDKFPGLAPDKIVLSFKDPAARRALNVYSIYAKDLELARDIRTRIDTIKICSNCEAALPESGKCKPCQDARSVL
jgi:hypothetical protein